MVTNSSSDRLVINQLVTRAARLNASDVHLAVGSHPAVRVDGALGTLADEPIVTAEFTRKIASLILIPDQLAALERDREVVVSFDLEGRIRFKASCFYQRGSLAIDLRLIPPQIPSLVELGLPAAALQLVSERAGLILVSGPYASGRTTTLAAMVDGINRMRREYITTLEQPIEYQFTNDQSIIEQREVGRDAVSFERGLSAIAGEDVNVVLISELVGEEPVRRALEVAAAGRLVLAGVTAESVFRTIEKLFLSFPTDRQEWARLELAELLRGILSLRLLARVGGGRTLVAEVMLPSPAVRTAIREGSLAQLANIMETSRETGMTSLDRRLAELVRAGQVSIEEALANAVDKANFRLMVGR